VPAHTFGTFTSVNPACAALAGWLVLHQALQPNEGAGIALIVASNVIVSLRGLTRSSP
jgi:inner membrane transporter RhtA